MSSWPLLSLIPENRELLLDRFLDYVKAKGLELYAAQEEAILELFSGRNVILNTPTGSGKSLVALALHFQSLATGKRSYYTSPIKALVNEKFFSLCRDFGPEQVGMVTGDATVNAQAPIICCTAEILMNDALREGDQAKVDDVVMDEFHYYSDRERGVAWQVPLLALPQARFLLMSATIGDPEPFERRLTELTGLGTVVVRSTERPVPLDFQYSEYPLHERVAQLIRDDRAPIYLVSFTQAACAEEAQNFLSVDICTKEEKRAVADELAGFKFSSPYGKELSRVLRHGMGIHHAGLLPKYRVLVEKLAQKGRLKIIFGTDTLGVGVNVPIRTVLLNKLCKFDGEKTALLSVRDFQQICGRAGRRGFDTLGTVVVQAPEHVIENLRNEQKAAGDARKLKKLVKRKPPEKGFVPWNEETFRKLVNGQPEALVSRFKVTHAMLLNVLARKEGPPHTKAGGAPEAHRYNDPCRAMRDLIRDCHEAEGTKRKLGKTAFQLFRSLVERKIIELDPLRVNVDLQEDFSLNHALSLYLVDTVQAIDPLSPGYALDVLTVVESILEDPELILRRQLDRLKGEKIRELKEQGMEYDARMEELEKLEYPKPNREFIYQTFNAFAAAHPWVGQENIRPKSIAREMIENFMSFADYVREYELQRAEGLLLRYLSEVYKTLLQNVPGYAKNDELYSISVYFGTIIREIDSSLIDEWERLKGGAPQRLEEPEAAAFGEPRVDARSLTIQIRNQLFRLLKQLASGDYEGASELLDGSALPNKLEDTMREYRDSGHSRVRLDAEARATKHQELRLEGAAEWTARQTILDLDDHNDWQIEVAIDPARTREQGVPAMRLVRIGPIL